MRAAHQLYGVQGTPARRYASLREAAVYLSMTEKGLRKLLKRRKVPFRRHGRRLMVDVHKLDVWDESLAGVTLDEALARTAPLDERARREMPPPRKT